MNTSTVSVWKRVCLLLALGMNSACQSDECLLLCTELSQRLNQCQRAWNTDWQYLDASSVLGFETVCQDIWTQRTSDLEWRQRVEAEEQCDAVRTELSIGAIECVDLQTLYFYDPQH